MRGGSRGFTLLELLLVVGLVCLMAALAVPNFRPVLYEADLEQAVRVLEVDLEWARAAARAAKKGVWIEFTEEGYSIYRESDESVEQLRVREWPRGVRLGGIDYLADDAVRFNGKGTPVDSSGTELREDVNITLRAGNGSWAQVIIRKKTGKVEATYP